MSDAQFAIVTVILRNNQRKQGYIYQTNPNVVVVELKSGLKEYTMDQIHSIEEMEEQNLKAEKVHVQPQMTNNSKEHNVEFMHWLDGDFRVLTNYFKSEAEEAAFSMARQNPLATPGFMVLNTGSFIPAFLINRLPANAQWRILVVPFRNERGEDILMDDEFYVQNSSFAWATASARFFMSVRGFSKWGETLALMGVKVINKKKTTKRAQELVRMTEMWTDAEPSVLMVTHREDESAMYYDGINVVSRSFALKMARNIADKAQARRTAKKIMAGDLVRMNFRYLSTHGLIKGDAIVVSDQQIARKHGRVYDIISHTENLKDEIELTHGHFTTGFWHHAYNLAIHDTQSMSWMKWWLFPQERVLQSMETMVNEFKADISSGELPAWITMTEDPHQDDAFGHMTKEQLSERLGHNYLKWQMAGLDIRSANNLCYMATNGLVTRMQSKYVAPSFKMWIPVANAFYGHVVTAEFLRNVAGFKDVQMDKVFYHAPTASVSIPGHRFEDSYAEHGGWDLDDSAKFIHIKLDGEDKVVVLRSPNGDGEYSIEDVDVESMPWQFNNMPVLELSSKDQPMFLRDIRKSITVEGLIEAKELVPGEVTQERALEIIQAQGNNPGIGLYANGLMTYFGLFDSTPEHLMAMTEDIVDAVQQTADLAQFAQIADGANKLFETIKHKALSTQTPCSLYLVRTRASQLLTDLADANLIHRMGYFDVVEQGYKKAMNDMRQFAKNNWLKERQNSKLVQQLKHVSVGGEEVLIWAKEFTAHAFRAFSSANKLFQVQGHMTRHQKLEAQQLRKLAMENLVRRMVNKLNEFDNPGLRAVALYKYVCKPVNRMTPYGQGDQFIFQPAATGEDSVMDLLITGLIELGLAKELPQV